MQHIPFGKYNVEEIKANRSRAMLIIAVEEDGDNLRVVCTGGGNNNLFRDGINVIKKKDPKTGELINLFVKKSFLKRIWSLFSNNK